MNTLPTSFSNPLSHLLPLMHMHTPTENKYKILVFRSSRHGAAETNPMRNHEVVGSP